MTCGQLIQQPPCWDSTSLWFPEVKCSVCAMNCEELCWLYESGMGGCSHVSAKKLSLTSILSRDWTLANKLWKRQRHFACFTPQSFCQLFSFELFATCTFSLLLCLFKPPGAEDCQEYSIQMFRRLCLSNDINYCKKKVGAGMMAVATLKSTAKHVPVCSYPWTGVKIVTPTVTLVNVFI